MDTDRRRRVLVAVAALALAITACGSDDDSGPEGLGDIRDSSPAGDETDDGEPTDGTEESPDTDDDDDEPADASAESDEPEEPDEVEPIIFDGVTVPDDALQINDDLDMPPEQQLEYLEFALEAFLYATTALNTLEWDADHLNRYFAQEQLESLLGHLERYEREGLRQVTDGAVLEYLRIHEYADGVAIVHRCMIDGPDDGVLDIDTGAYTFESDTPYWLAAISVEPVGDGGVGDDLRVARGGGAGDASCP